MKIGIIGGIGPASTLDYYTGIIDGFRRSSPNGQYPEIVIDSVNMSDMLALVEQGDEDKLAEFLLSSIKNLENAGASFAAIASNTPHIVFDRINKSTPIPLLSIVEETCKETKKQGYSRLVLFGTAFTMKRSFYADVMRKNGIELIVPNMDEQETIHGIIFPNLEDGIVLPEQKEKMLKLANEIMIRENAQALILGCTELPLMVKPDDLDYPILDTAQIHINAIVDMLSSPV